MIDRDRFGKDGCSVSLDRSASKKKKTLPSSERARAHARSPCARTAGKG